MTDLTKETEVFNSITITNFRCFEQFHLDDLAQVNLIAGMNSVGKTAFLEALYLLIGAENLPLVMKIAGFRGIQKFEGSREDIVSLLWAPLFHDLDTQTPITIEGQIGTGATHRVELSLVPQTSQRLPQMDLFGFDFDARTETSKLTSKILHLRYVDPTGQASHLDMKFDEEEGGLSIKPVPQEPPFPGYFSHAHRPSGPENEANLYSKLVKSKKSYDLLQALSPVEERLQSIQSLHITGQSMLWGDVGLEEMLPLGLLGGGMNSLASILLRIVNAPNGIVLIDEVENGIHYSVLKDLWLVIRKAAMLYNTQVFATTHSYECIRAGHQVFSQAEDYDFRLHRLDRLNGQVTAVTYDQASLSAAIDADFEVR